MKPRTLSQETNTGGFAATSKETIMNTIATPIKESMNMFKRVPVGMLGMAVFATAMVGSVNADPVIYEPFGQTGGDAALTGQAASGIGLTGLWATIGEGSMKVADGSLSYGGLATSGNFLRNSGRRQGNFAGINSALSNAGLLADGGVLWFSLLHKLGSANNTNANFGFALGTDAMRYVNDSQGIPFNGSGAGVGFRIANTDQLTAAIWAPGTAPNINAGLAVDLAPGGTEFGSTVLIVGKITWGVDGSALDKVDLYLPNTSLTEGPVKSSVSLTIDQSTLDNITFCGSLTAPADYYNIDEIRFGASFADVTPVPVTGFPVIASVSPGDEATDVPRNAALVATFDKQIDLTGNGSVTIYNVDTASNHEVITLPDARVTVFDFDLTITPGANLATSTNYAVLISNDAVKNLSTADLFAGISNPDTWDFTTTADGTAPTISSTNPADDATGVAPYSNLVATFSEDVVLSGAGTVTIRDVALASNAIVITLPNPQVAVSGTTLTINPIADLSGAKEYAVQITGDAIEDPKGNPFAGIADDTTWSFTTPAPPSGGVVVTPGHINGVPVYGVTGTLVAVDVPYLGAAPSISGPVGPDWPENADDGWRLFSDSSAAPYGSTSPWEPDGTALAEAVTLRLGSGQGASYTFDLPAGTVINAIYATWQSRVSSGATWGYTEGAASDSNIVSMASAPTADLALDWTDAATTVRTGNFQRVLAGPIAVLDGDGFTLNALRSSNHLLADAVVLDVTLPVAGAPAIASVSPGDEATDVPRNAALVATFDKLIDLTGNGSVTIYNVDTASNHEVITLPDARVTGSAYDLTITPGANLATSTNYAVLVSNDAVKNISTADLFAGISNPDTWDFTTTADGTPPTISSTNPADDATGVAPYSDLVATFNEGVALSGAGTVTIRDVALASDAIVITLPDARVSVSGTTLTINPTAHLSGATAYAVRITGDAIEDLKGNPFAGIADDTTWSFTTANPPSGGVVVTPGHINGVPVYGVTGTLFAVDVPYQGTTFPIAGPVGADWPQNADDGWRLLSGSSLAANEGTSPWEPDGTDLAEAVTLRLSNSAPGTSYTFALPDGAVINAIYATWLARSTSGATWSYTEGAASNSNSITMVSAPTADLALDWTDAATTVHTGNFQRVLTGPITVEGGNGFTLKAVRTNSSHQADAVVLDVTLPGGGTSFATWIGGFGLAPGDQDFTDDPDGDNLSNGIEGFFGTDPSEGNTGLTQVAKSGNSMTFQHPEAETPLSNVTGSYKWSLDLATWNSPGATAGGVTVGIPDPPAPVNGITTVTATITAGTPAKLFLRLVVTQP